MKKKIFVAIFLLLILLSNVAFASYSTVTMEVVKEPVCTIQIGKNAKFEKSLISKDLNNKEVTLQLKVTNEEVANKPTGEVVLVLDNSNSMTKSNSTGAVRGELIYNSTKKLIENLLKDNTNLKIGVVSFSAAADSTNADGTYVDNTGTINDAVKISDLSNDTSSLITAVSNIPKDGPQTDLEAGLTMAKDLFTQTSNNKYMIVLTDGIPNISINHSYSSSFYSDEVFANTKAALENVEKAGINLLTMLTGIENPDEQEAGAPIGAKTQRQIIEEVFGTAEKPTAGKFYYITDDKIEETITTSIYNDLMPTSASYKDIKIVDYFPKEIIDNFDFSYVNTANIGEISAEVDKTTNSITWTIPELKSGETATVQYKLKLKENFDSSIVGKILNTNEKVDITYKDLDDKDQSKTSDVSPQLKLTEPATPSITPKKQLPAAGLTSFLVVFLVLAIGIFGYSLTRLIIINNKEK